MNTQEHNNNEVYAIIEPAVFSYLTGVRIVTNLLSVRQSATLVGKICSDTYDQFKKGLRKSPTVSCADVRDKLIAAINAEEQMPQWQKDINIGYVVGLYEASDNVPAYEGEASSWFPYSGYERGYNLKDGYYYVEDRVYTDGHHERKVSRYESQKQFFNMKFGRPAKSLLSFAA